MKDWTTPALVVLILIAGFVAVRSIGANAALRAEAKVAKAEAVAWQTQGDSIQVVVDSLSLANFQLDIITKALAKKALEIKAESDSMVALLKEERKMVRLAIAVSAADLRAKLPPVFVPAFDEYDSLRDAELAASENETKQVQRKVTATEALNATLSTELFAVKVELAETREGWRLEKIQSVLWKESSGKFEAALGGGFFAGLFGDLPQLVAAVGVGMVLASL